MPRARDPNRDKAFLIYKKHDGKIDLVEIANQLNLPAGTIRGWKSKDNWDDKLNGTFQKNTERSKRNRGGQLGNKNAVGNDGGGAPKENKNAEKHGFFSKWLPPETAAIMKEIEKTDPLDILWDNIQLQYTAILRAQRIMFVMSQEDTTTTKIGEGSSATGSSEKWEVQYAWDKQATFLTAQSRAMKTLESMINRYDEMLHKNWELATEEQKTRIEVMKSRANLSDNGIIEDDGFMKAILAKDDDLWKDE